MESDNCSTLTRYESKHIADDKAAMFSTTYVGRPQMVSFACGDHWHVDRASRRGLPNGVGGSQTASDMLNPPHEANPLVPRGHRQDVPSDVQPAHAVGQEDESGERE